MSKSNQYLTTIAAATLLCATTVHADENIFGYTYTADVMPKGEWELEQSFTSRTGKESGSFLGLDMKTEIETGLTDRLQASLYLTYNYFNAHNAVASDGPIGNKNFFDVNGTSAEFKYQVLSPYKDRFGLAFIVEPEYGSIESADGSRHDEFGLEGRIILEKHWREDTVVGTFNYTIEPEWEKGAGDSGYNLNLKMEGATGLAYRFAPNWYVGLETRVQTEFGEADLGQSELISVFAGPSLHYASKRWWATLTVLPQVWGWPDAHGTGGLALSDNERLEVRLKFGFDF